MNSVAHRIFLQMIGFCIPQLSRKGADLANAMMDAIQAAMKESCAVTADMWTNSFKTVTYTNATVHFVGDNWMLQSKALFTCDFPKERKAGKNTRK